MAERLITDLMHDARPTGSPLLLFHSS